MYLLSCIIYNDLYPYYSCTPEFLNSEGWRVELSATWSKVPHHKRGGGHLLVSMGATSRYPHLVLFAPVT